MVFTTEKQRKEDQDQLILSYIASLAKLGDMSLKEPKQMYLSTWLPELPHQHP